MISGYIDMRSDTVTVPTPAMREAMAGAEVGDDVYREDPTVNKLQQMAADLLGKEAGLLLSSGTQGNLIALLAHCQRADEIIVGDRSHIFSYEQGGSAALAGAHARPVAQQRDGTLRIEDIEAAIQPDNEHYPITRLVCLENTTANQYGAPLPPAYIRQVGELAHARNLQLHIDGARFFNAAAALPGDVRANARALAEHADSLTFCLSKGLGAPVGSVLVGSKAFIHKAHRARKLVGGAMRQAGVFAAAGVVALETMIDRLREDHANALRFAERVARIPGLKVELDRVRTNIVFIDVLPEARIAGVELSRRVLGQRVRLGGYGDRIRAVTHCWVSTDEVDEAAAAIEHVMSHV